MTNEELMDLMEERALGYRFLSRAFRTAPDAALIDAVLRMADAERADDDPLAPFYAEAADADAETLRIDLAADYNQLFLGMSAHPVAPYESVYTSDEGLMMQEARDEVLAVYRSEGLDKLPSWKESEDHIALELEFMAVLGDRIVTAAEAADEAEVERLLSTQRNFLEDHLASWAPLMTADLRRFTQCGLYQGLASLTDGFLQVEEEFFDEIFETEGE